MYKLLVIKIQKGFFGMEFDYVFTKDSVWTHMFTDILLLFNLIKLVEKSAHRQNSTGLCNHGNLSFFQLINRSLIKSFCVIF